MKVIEILMMEQVQLGIFAIIVLALVLNFIVKLCLIRAGIYKRIYKQRKVNWEKFKGGIFLIGFGGLLITAYQYSWRPWLAFLGIICLVGITQVISALFLNSKSWKSYKYWD